MLLFILRFINAPPPHPIYVMYVSSHNIDGLVEDLPTY